ncbi:hypothetical protein JVW24_20950, partial [Vibrio cholerae O1]|nr:hypothetical protein [Vibrio cholerae O1]
RQIQILSDHSGRGHPGLHLLFIQGLRLHDQRKYQPEPVRAANLRQSLIGKVLQLKRPGGERAKQVLCLGGIHMSGHDGHKALR